MFCFSFCGLATVDTEFTQDGFETLELCFEVESYLPPDAPVNDDLLYICIDAVPAQRGFLEFERCNIKINDRSCNSCTMCEGNRDLTFDCTNIDINPIRGGDFIPGPNSTACFGFGFLLGTI